MSISMAISQTHMPTEDKIQNPGEIVKPVVWDGLLLRILAQQQKKHFQTHRICSKAVANCVELIMILMPGIRHRRGSSLFDLRDMVVVPVAMPF